MSKKDITIDHALRATWQAIIKMYNEQAAKLDSTIEHRPRRRNTFYSFGASNGNGSYKSFKNLKIDGRTRSHRTQTQSG